MVKNSTTEAKPRTTRIRSELTRLPELDSKRLRFRRMARRFLRGLVRLTTRLTVQGLENIPAQGPLLMVSNHLGDADALIGLAVSPRPVELIAKIELVDMRIVGQLMESYGVIWIHRGQPDRHALRAAMDGLRTGRVIGIAPEGRESLTGSLEAGTEGAAYLALKSGAPILPVTFTGTQNRVIFRNLKRFKRSPVTVTIGKTFTLDESVDRKEALRMATDQIMHTLASQLPLEYQGVYLQELEVDHDSQEH